MNNTNQHISNESVYVKFDPTGTAFNSGITNVQDALAILSPDGVVGVPDATQSVVGKARFGTQQEVLDGVSASLMVSPATLEARMQRPFATTAVFGTTRYATNAEALTGTAADRSIVASALKHVLDWTFENRVATETAKGVLKLSTTAAAVAGTDDTTAMTPLKTRQAIAAATDLIPAYGQATEAAQGVVRLATLAQLRTPSIREGYSMSPYTMNQWQATEANIGAAKVAATAAMNAGTSDTDMVTPLKFAQTRASSTRTGTVRLSDTVSGDNTLALSGAAKVLRSDVSTVSIGGVYEGSIAPQNKYMTNNDLRSVIPVGTMMLAAYSNDRGALLICNGRQLNKNQYPELFSAIGYTYGGSGDMFAIPDMRGLTARGWDNGRNLDPGRTFGSRQDDAMQRLQANWIMDDQAVEFRRPTGCLDAGSKGAVWYDAKSDGNRAAYWVHFDSGKQSRTAAETRVKSLALNYVICAR